MESRFIEVKESHEQLIVGPPLQQRKLFWGDGVFHLLRPQDPARLRVPHRLSRSYDY